MIKFKNGLAKVGDVFHYCFRINGTQFKGSTRATDKATAEKVVAEIRKEALLGAKPAPVTLPTVAELATAWKRDHESALSPKHVHNVGQLTEDWILPNVGDLPIDQVTTQMILDVRSKMLEAGRALPTTNHMIRVARLLWNYAVRMDFIERVPFKVSQLRVQRKPRPTIPARQVAEFFNTIDQITKNPQVRTMIRMMVGLGLRSTELRFARREWLDSNRKTYCVGRSKGKEARVLPIPEWLWTYLSEPPSEPSEWMFPNKKGKPYGVTFLCRYITKASARIGIQRLSQHRLRGSFATLHAQAGTPITEIQGMLGHKAIQTTLGYIEQTLEAKRTAQDALGKKLGLA